MTCPYPDCSWQAIAPSENGARNAYLKHVVTEHTDDGGAASVEWFEQSAGHVSRWHTPENRQVFIVLEGDLLVHTEDTAVELSTSDSMRIEAGERHYSENPGERPCVGLRVSAPRPARSDGSP